MWDLSKPKHAETAEEFLEHLRPSAPHWLGEELNRPDYIEGNGWICRGHSNHLNETGNFEEWQLVPKAFRPNAYAEFIPSASILWSNEIDEFERRVVNNFLKLADREGLSIPTREISRDWYWSVAKRLRDQDLEAAALAQHHGIPTRLLDWTDSPLKAAYFAAKGVASVSKEANITVWAFRASLFEYLNLPHLAAGETEPIYHGVKVVREKRHVNGFLMAQDGCFTLDTVATHEIGNLANYRIPNRIQNIQDFEVRATNKSQKKLVEFYKNQSSSFIWFHKATLPWSEVPNLKKLLWYEGINPVALMPTFDNVAEALKYKLEVFDSTA